MPETRGYATINDRTDGYGPGVDPDKQPTVDAAFEPPRNDDAQPDDRMDATNRWTRELEQRFTKAAVLNPDIEDRLHDDLESFDDLSKDTEVTGGKQDAVDDKSYRTRIFNRPTHQGELHQLEGDYFLHMSEDERTVAKAHYVYDDEGRTLVGPDGEEVDAELAANADNRDRASGWGVTVPSDNVPGAGEWEQGTREERELDGVTYFPETGFAAADLPNEDTEHETDYIDPNDAPEGAPVESNDPPRLHDVDQDGTPNNLDPDYEPGDEYDPGA